MCMYCGSSIRTLFKKLAAVGTMLPGKSRLENSLQVQWAKIMLKIVICVNNLTRNGGNLGEVSFLPH